MLALQSKTNTSNQISLAHCLQEVAHFYVVHVTPFESAPRGTANSKNTAFGAMVYIVAKSPVCQSLTYKSDSREELLWLQSFFKYPQWLLSGYISL